MSYSFEYVPVPPHGKFWAEGYKIGGSSCFDKVLNDFGGEIKGPISGQTFTIRHIPWFGSSPTYVRFWAAMSSNQPWKNETVGYMEKSGVEKEPSPDYPNGGIVKVSKKGKATFRLQLPAGYNTELGYVPPHFHYRLCFRGKMSPVHTQYLHRPHVNCRSSLMVLNEHHKLDNTFQASFSRMYHHTPDPKQIYLPAHQKTQQRNKETENPYAGIVCQTALQTDCDHSAPGYVNPGPISGGGLPYQKPVGIPYPVGF